MNNRKIEFLVGCFVLIGFGAVLYLAIQVGSARFFGSDSYELEARFRNTSGVNPGSRVEIAGVRVGTVRSIILDDNFYSIVTLELPNDLMLDDDTSELKCVKLVLDKRPQGWGELAPVDGNCVVQHGLQTLGLFLPLLRVTNNSL